MASCWLTLSRTVIRLFLVISSRHFLLRIGGEADVAVGQDADELARIGRSAALDHRNAGYAVLLHQHERVGQRRVRLDGERIDHHAGFEFFDLADQRGLLLRLEVAVDDAEAAGLRHGDRHDGFGDGIHGRGDDRNIERDFARDARAHVGFGRQHVGQAGLEQHVIEGERFAQATVRFCGHCQTPSGRSAGNADQSPYAELARADSTRAE